MHEMRGLGGFQGKANCLEMILMILNSSLDHATKMANKNLNLIIWLCFKVYNTYIQERVSYVLW